MRAALCTSVGLLWFALAAVAIGRGPYRLLATVPAATLIGMLLLERGGGAITLAAWLAAGAVSLLRVPARPAAAVAPTPL